MLKTVALTTTALAVALTGTAIARTAGAHADYTEARPTCVLPTDPDVTASADAHGYHFDLDCGASGHYHVDANYILSEHRGWEQIHGLDAPYDLDAVWLCDVDPWSTPGAPPCTEQSGSQTHDYGPFASAQIGGFDGVPLGGNSLPFSVVFAPSNAVNVFAAKLQDALNAQPQQQAQPQPQQAPALNLSASGRNINPNSVLPLIHPTPGPTAIH